MTESHINAALNFAEKNLDNALETLFGLLKIKSISSESEFRPECINAGQYLVDELNRIGFKADLRDGLGPVSYTHLDVYKRQALLVESFTLTPSWLSLIHI